MFALAGVITATLASWVLERATGRHDDDEPATRAQVRALTEKVDALSRAGGRRDGPDASGSPGAPGHERRVDGLGDGGDERPGG